MLKIALPSVFVLAIGMALSVPSLAEEPVPAPKPLQVPGNTRFVEGVDVPPRKPVPEKAAKASAKQERVEKAACDLAGAVFEIRTPISGEQSGDAGCGIEEPVAVTAIETGAERVNFRGTVTISCDFAKIVTDWVRSDVLSISEKHFDAKIETIATGPGYQCRTKEQPAGRQIVRACAGQGNRHFRVSAERRHLCFCRKGLGQGYEEWPVSEDDPRQRVQAVHHGAQSGRRRFSPVPPASRYRLSWQGLHLSDLPVRAVSVDLEVDVVIVAGSKAPLEPDLHQIRLAKCHAGEVQETPSRHARLLRAK